MTEIDTLLELLDEYLTQVDSLTDIARREAEQLRGFDVERVRVCTDERRALLERTADKNAGLRAAAQSLQRALGAGSQPMPLRELATLCGDKHRSALLARCDALRKRAAALHEQNVLNALLAERGLRTVRGYMALLQGAAAETERYTAKGKVRGHKRGATVARQA